MLSRTIVARLYRSAVLRPRFASSSAPPVDLETRVTVLPNRIQVATNEIASHIQSVGVIVAAGSRYETDETRGFSYILSKMAFKSSKNRTTTDYALDMERYVSNLACHMGRESTLYQAHCPSQNLSPVLSLLSDTILAPHLAPAEVDETILAASYELELYDQKIDGLLIETLQDVAFGGEAIGRPNFPERSAVSVDEHGYPPRNTPLTRQRLEAFRQKWYRPERMVVAGTGMSHEVLVNLTMEKFGHLQFEPSSTVSASGTLDPYPTPPPSPSSSPSYASSSSGPTWLQSLTSAFGSSPSSSSSSSSQSQTSAQPFSKAFATLAPSPTSELIPPPVGLPRTRYTGGVSIEERAEEELSHVFVGFEGFDANHDDVYPLAVIQMLLGDGASFSSGGPGKGLLSRFYTGVMSGSYGIDNVNSLNLPFSDAGIFAVSVACQPSVLQKSLNRLAFELSSLLNPSNATYPVQAVELSRAKNRLKSTMLYAREDPRIEGEDLGAQVLTNGYRMPIAEMIGKIDGVTMDDVARVARKVMVEGVGNGELTVVAGGAKVGGVVSMVKRAWMSKGLSCGTL